MGEKSKNKFFGSGTQIIRGKKWNWETFKSTEGYPVPDNLLSWVIGQDEALKVCRLCLYEWVHKIKWMMKTEWWKGWSDPNKPKPNVKAWIPAGPFLLMLGDAGTGKSLIGRALAEELTKLYRKHGIQLYDVICWENKEIPSEPKISVHPSPKGKKLVIDL
ncbi:MAG: hypothetical protein DRO40_13805, partial [Thermoprotei archaeon]